MADLMERLHIKPRGGEMEKEMPFALMQLSVDLGIGKSFDGSLRGIAKGYGKFSELAGNALAWADEGGMTMEQALLKAGRESGSARVERAFAQLISAYRQGNKSASSIIRKIGREQLASQRGEAREFGAKLSLMSLIVVVFSAVVPAMLQSLVSLGSMVLSMGMQPIDVLLLANAGIPLVNAMLLFGIRARTPAFMR